MTRLESHDLRTEYVAQYGKAAWTRAVYLAGSHRRRAATQYGLLEHWTAPEWLNLCALWDMKCPRCHEAKSLTPHYRVDMCRGGSKLIANILPVCDECHGWVGGMDCSDGWLNRQRALVDTLQPGVLVFWAAVIGLRGPTLLAIADLFPPVPMASAPPVTVRDAWWGNGCSHRKSGLVVVGRELTEWAGAWARTTDDRLDIGYEAEELIPYSPETYGVWLQHREAERVIWQYRVPRRRSGQFRSRSGDKT